MFSWLIKERSISVFLLAIGFLLVRIIQTNDSRFLSVLFLNVGQGDSAFVRLPSGESFLVDAGGGWSERESFSNVISPLIRKGVLGIDFAILSHPDWDHLHGFLWIPKFLTIRNFYTSHHFERDQPSGLKTLVNKLEQLNVPKVYLKSVRQFQFGATKVQLIPLGEKATSKNNNSMVLEVEHAGCRLFFGGDIHSQGETEWMKRFGKKIDILKVSHHGSQTSSWWPFLDLSEPKLAVISSGKGNSYGHPSPHVLNRFKVQKTRVLRTDFHGDIELKISSEGQVQCFTAAGECGRYQCPKSSSTPTTEWDERD